MSKKEAMIPEIIRNKWPELTFVRVAKVKIEKPIYTIDRVDGGPVTGWRLIYSIGFVTMLETEGEDR